jgi:hypothetical protein
MYTGATVDQVFTRRVIACHFSTSVNLPGIIFQRGRDMEEQREQQHYYGSSQVNRGVFASDTTFLANKNSGSYARHQSAIDISNQSAGCSQQSNRLFISTILCGGAGSRLCPVSRELRLKSFISLADGQSLLQKVFL